MVKAARQIALLLICCLFLSPAYAKEISLSELSSVIASDTYYKHSITLPEELAVYSLKPPFPQLGFLKKGAKVTLIRLEGESMMRIRFKKGDGLAEAQCKLEDLLPPENAVPPLTNALPAPTSIYAAFTPSGQALDMILKELYRAKESIDIAMFYLSEEKLMDALCYIAGTKKIPIRLFIDESMAKAAHKPKLDKLADHGIRVYVEQLASKGKMHLKTAVVDKKIVLTGCANWTDAGFEENFEDVLIIESSPLAQAYIDQFNSFKKEFDPLEGTYGEEDNSKKVVAPPTISKKAKKTKFATNRKKSFRNIARMENYFTPGREGINRLLLQAKKAKNIVIDMYIISDKKVMKSLCDIAQQGKCKITMLVDDSMIAGTYLHHLQTLWDAGIEIRYFKAPRKSLHLKTAIIDGRYIWSGSMNWTKAGIEKNIENMLMLESRDLAEYYLKNLEAISQKCESFARISVSSLLSNTKKNKSILSQKIKNKYAQNLPPTQPRTIFRNLMIKAPSELIETKAYVRYLDDQDYLPTLLELINGAHQSILITMFTVPVEARKKEQVSTEKVISALEQAVKRGVYVYMVLHMPSTEESSLHKAHSALAERLRAEGVDVRLNLPFVHLHEKMVVVDLAKVLIGSHNWSEGALSGKRVYESTALMILPKQNLELGQYVLSRKIIQDMDSREAWEKEANLLRYIPTMPRKKKSSFIKELEEKVRQK